VLVSSVLFAFRGERVRHEGVVRGLALTRSILW
jgi:hypothetical protein